MDALEHTPEHDAGPVLGLDNIALELPLAGVGSRLLAGVVDYFLLTLAMIVYTLVGALALAALPGIGGGLKVALFLIGFFLLHWGYFTGFEAATRGRTPGKRVVGLRVVGREGGTPSRSAFVIRNVLRDFDLLIGVPLMAFDPSSRRLGDRVAGTLVIHEQPRGRELVLGRIPPSWGAREVAVVEAFLQRSELSPEQTARLGARLVALVERDAPELLAGVPREGGPRELLRRALEVHER